VGTLAMAPMAGLHHFVPFPSYYSSTAQWEWDTGTALVQGGLFAILYRFLIARGDNVQAMQTVILSTVVSFGPWCECKCQCTVLHYLSNVRSIYVYMYINEFVLW
jgi:hypothetical protein